ncbi:MAG: TIGR00701 family protein [Deltaproteobacteria bacterium]|nr:TIGR00701 family protein [Deltaproteobacteria bacterium]
MTEFWIHAFLWIKALHIISIISWMAGLLYLPRLFVYHCQAPAGSHRSETFKVMENKLSRLIMFPAMLASLGFGFLLLASPGYLAAAGLWLWLKILLVAGLCLAHWQMVKWRDDFAHDRNSRPERFYRIANEAPTLLMIGIVILVVVRPF